jgi:preprotein translocase subunit SecA
MNIINNLPNEIQELIYNQYLEKQRDYHINQYKNRIKLLYFDKLKENIEHINTYIVDECFNSYSDLEENSDYDLDEMEEDFNDNAYKCFVEYYFGLCKYV